MREYSKPLLFVGILIALAALDCQNQKAFAFHNEPGHFQGIVWGTDIRDLDDMVLHEDGGDSKFYRRQGDAVMIGAANLESCNYIFYRERLYKVFIEFTSLSNAHAIKNFLFQNYGEGLSLRLGRNVKAYQWSGSLIDIRYDFGEASNKGTLTYVYKPIEQEKESNEEKGPKRDAPDS